MSGNVLVVPALGAGDSGRPIEAGLQEMYQLLRHEGLGILNLAHAPSDTEYNFNVSPHTRGRLRDYLPTQQSVVDQADALVVVNDATEVVVGPDGKRIATVPCAVGQLALGVMRMAHEAFGPGSGRIFLSDTYPDGSNLAALADPESRRQSVVMAQRRIFDVYPLGPIALNEQYDRLVEVARTPREGRAR
jgi:hypothetical protein